MTYRSALGLFALSHTAMWVLLIAGILGSWEWFLAAFVAGGESALALDYANKQRERELRRS